MSFLEKLGKKLGIIPENKTEEIMKERSAIKETMAKKLSDIGFTNDEIDEVLAILTKSEADVQKQKDLLIGTNINNPYPNLIMREIFEEIRHIELKAASDIKAKIAEITERKKSQ